MVALPTATVGGKGWISTKYLGVLQEGVCGDLRKGGAAKSSPQVGTAEGQSSV